MEKTAVISAGSCLKSSVVREDSQKVPLTFVNPQISLESIIESAPEANGPFASSFSSSVRDCAPPSQRSKSVRPVRTFSLKRDFIGRQLFVVSEINKHGLATAAQTLIAHQTASSNVELMRPPEAMDRKFEGATRKMTDSMDSQTQRLIEVTFVQTDKSENSDVEGEIAVAVASEAGSVSDTF
ncbi:hypothetical protein EDD11_006542 [Mortierella claussenii]|nr:hypothetical protein EDD11_006542 [Mortierella claussenii]